MIQNCATASRPRGRPRIRSDSETLTLMVEAAEQEFQVGGYAGTSMCAVARHAGVSTRTVYRLVPTKAELFRRVVSYRLGHFMLAATMDARDQAGLKDALARLLVAFGELALSKEVVAIYGLVLAEHRRFPELAHMFLDEAIHGASDAMTAWLLRHQQRGLLTLEDAGQATGMLRGMMIMDPQRAALLGHGKILDRDGIVARADVCAALFLRGCCG
jgi:AcrR family transcriptional regulator